MSDNSCGHSIKAYKDNPLGEPYQPTEKEIRERCLYQCNNCKKWFSLLG